MTMNARNPLVGLFQKSFEKPSDLLCCAFGLKNSELDVYFSLIAGLKKVEDIAERIGKDRSTVQRVLNKLHTKGLVKRDSRRIERGGYFYEYTAQSTEFVREQILIQLEEWYLATRNFLLESWSQTPKKTGNWGKR
jgi:predicted transcriptional regulator